MTNDAFLLVSWMLILTIVFVMLSLVAYLVGSYLEEIVEWLDRMADRLLDGAYAAMWGRGGKR